MIRNWLVKKDEQRKRKELAEAKIKENKEKERQVLLEKERENFKQWLANKKLEEKKAKAKKLKDEGEKKQQDTEKDKNKAINNNTYNQWVIKKRRLELGNQSRFPIGLRKIF